MQQTLRSFIEAHRIRMTAELTDHNPNMANDNWAKIATHWRCTIRKGQRRMTVYFSQGSAHTSEPTLADVLDCLASAALGFENARSFEDWCGEYGYNTDSRKAEATYRTIGRQVAGLKALLGLSPYATLTQDVERL